MASILPGLINFDMFDKGNQGHKSRRLVVVVCLGLMVIFFVLAYAMASLAIDSGSLLQYFTSIMFVYLGVRSVMLAVHAWKKLG